MPRTAAGGHRDAPDRDGPPPDRPSIARGPTTVDAPRRDRPISDVDAADPPSVSFAATGGDGPGAEAPSSRSLGQEGNAHDGIGPGLPGSVLLGGRAGFAGVNPFPIIGARIHPPLLRADTLTPRSPQRVARRGRHWSRRARRRGSRVRQDDAPRRLGPQQPAPDGVVPARSGRPRLAHVLPASRRERPRARPGVRAGHATPCSCALGPAVRPEPTSRPASCANTPSSARASRRD